jgi:hypothetical protein
MFSILSCCFAPFSSAVLQPASERTTLIYVRQSRGRWATTNGSTRNEADAISHSWVKLFTHPRG